MCVIYICINLHQLSALKGSAGADSAVVVYYAVANNKSCGEEKRVTATM